jgi:hypothetical protein
VASSAPPDLAPNHPVSKFPSNLHLFLPIFEFHVLRHVSLSGVASFCLHFSGSEHSTEDSDFRIDDPDEAAAFEIKKRNIDETRGRPPRCDSSRHTGKTNVGGGSSAVAGQ